MRGSAGRGSTTWEVGLIVDGIENVADKDRGVFFEEIRDFGFAQSANGICVSIVTQECENVISEDICICV
jgi:hypothetical protein